MRQSVRDPAHCSTALFLSFNSSSRIPFFFSAKASYVLALTHEDFFLSARQSKIHERKLHQIVLSYL
jgi:hypothetical protein